MTAENSLWNVMGSNLGLRISMLYSIMWLISLQKKYTPNKWEQHGVRVWGFRNIQLLEGDHFDP